MLLHHLVAVDTSRADGLYHPLRGITSANNIPLWGYFNFMRPIWAQYGHCVLCLKVRTKTEAGHPNRHVYAAPAVYTAMVADLKEFVDKLVADYQSANDN